MKHKIRPFYAAVLFGIIACLFVFEALSSKNLAYHFAFVGYGGTFQNHALKIFGIPVYWFLMLCGFALTFAESLSKRERYGMSRAAAILLPVAFLATAYCGGKLLYIIENFSDFRRTGLSLDGMSLFGAVYLVLLLAPVAAWITKKKTAALYDYFTPFGLILLAATRTGCFCNGCCGAVKFWHGVMPVILPVQLFEVVCDLLILEGCYAVERRYPEKGRMYPAFLLLYGTCRFLLEFLRDTPKDWLGLSHGQVFSLIAIAIAALFFIICRKQQKTA